MKLVNSMLPFRNLRYPTVEQTRIWFSRKKGTPPSEIARQMGVSRPYVSQAQRIAEERIEKLLRHSALTTRVALTHISPKHGIAIGECPALDTRVYFTYTSQKGVQVWYQHQGTCDTCGMAEECTEILATLATEWDIVLPDDLPPTEAGNELFKSIMEELGWK